MRNQCSLLMMMSLNLAASVVDTFAVSRGLSSRAVALPQWQVERAALLASYMGQLVYQLR
jgi:hypothetical protein